MFFALAARRELVSLRRKTQGEKGIPDPPSRFRSFGGSGPPKFGEADQPGPTPPDSPPDSGSGAGASGEPPAPPVSGATSSSGTISSSGAASSNSGSTSTPPSSSPPSNSSPPGVASPPPAGVKVPGSALQSSKP